MGKFYSSISLKDNAAMLNAKTGILAMLRTMEEFCCAIEERETKADDQV